MQFQSERDALQEQLSEAHATADQLRSEIQVSQYNNNFVLLFATIADS
jgi:hypothetical protein